MANGVMNGLILAFTAVSGSPSVEATMPTWNPSMFEKGGALEWMSLL